MSSDDLGDRMKYYESIPSGQLMAKVPVLIRLDGKAFHTLTRNMERPYDRKFAWAMHATAAYLCENIQGCQLAYVQSDEIQLLLVDYQTIKTQGWFGYSIQKMVSISAALATLKFNAAKSVVFPDLTGQAVFDSRAWNLPKDDVTNAFIWRQQDATRNSIQMLGQAHFSHNQLHGLSCNEIQEKLFQEKGINWNNCEVWQKRGVCVIKMPQPVDKVEPPLVRNRWMIDMNIPIFTQDREYIDRFVFPEETE